MDDAMIRQKVKNAFNEPRAPEELIRSVALRAGAVVLGRRAQAELQTARREEYAELISLGLVGQMAMNDRLPEGTQPRQLAQQLQQLPFFTRAMRGEDLPRRLSSGELLQQLVRDAAEPEKEMAQPQRQGPEGLCL